MRYIAMTAYGGHLAQPYDRSHPTLWFCSQSAARLRLMAVCQGMRCGGQHRFGNFSFDQAEVNTTGSGHSRWTAGLAHSPVLSSRHKTLPPLYQTLRSKERKRGFNKGQRKLSRRNAN